MIVMTCGTSDIYSPKTSNEELLKRRREKIAEWDKLMQARSKYFADILKELNKERLDD